jgi:hypothetical protein
MLCWQICSIHKGQLVWARHKNRRYYKGRIADISETQFYMVLFSDGSFSDDLYPKDITVSIEWSKGILKFCILFCKKATGFLMMVHNNIFLLLL